ncbi:MAG: ferritin family protein [Anaerolineae bacterium]|nr:MAG: ferritin family protein [Anaerolineae bacterium]
MNIRKVYAYALERERQGKRFFEENAARASHASVVGIFERLAREEGAHITFIQGLIDHLDQGQPASVEALAGDLPLAETGFFSERAASELIDQTTIESMTPDLPVLRVAYLIERDFSEFYEMAAVRAEGEAQEALSLLARWERSHEALFKGLHDRLFEEYVGMPWGG